MQTATVYGYSSKKSGCVMRYIFKVRFSDTVRKFIHYGMNRNQCLVHLINQLNREFPFTKIVLDRVKLCSKSWFTAAVKVTRDNNTYVRIHYNFDEAHDVFDCDYKCDPDADPVEWMNQYLKMNTPEGEYFRYMSEHPERGFGAIMRLL